MTSRRAGWIVCLLFLLVPFAAGADDAGKAQISVSRGDRGPASG